MYRNFTFNAIFWIILGLALFGWGIYNAWFFRRAITNFFVLQTVLGFSLTGLAAVLCGYTNGFTDHTPQGRMLKKAGIFLGIIGLPMMGYVIWRSL